MEGTRIYISASPPSYFVYRTRIIMLYWAWLILGTMLALIILGKHVSKTVHKFVKHLTLHCDHKTVKLLSSTILISKTSAVSLFHLTLTKMQFLLASRLVCRNYVEV